MVGPIGRPENRVSHVGQGQIHKSLFFTMKHLYTYSNVTWVGHLLDKAVTNKSHKAQPTSPCVLILS